MTSLKINVYNRQNVSTMPHCVRTLIRKCCSAFLIDEGITFPVEVDFTFLDNAQIQKLNLEYRNKDLSTDVLSFPLGENGEWDFNQETGRAMLGDVVISLEKVKTQAEIYGHSVERELAFLVIHSMLHLFGYNHEDVDGIDALKMREREEKILSQVGFPKDTSYMIDGKR